MVEGLSLTDSISQNRYYLKFPFFDALNMWIMASCIQPEDDDIKAHWDKLVVSAKSFPCLYWDKFIKKRVRSKNHSKKKLTDLWSGATKVRGPV